MSDRHRRPRPGGLALRPALVVVFACLAPAVSAPLHAQAPSAPASEASLHAKAYALAQVLQSESIAVDASMKLLDTSFPAALAASPDVKPLEDEFPGFTVAVWTAAKPHLREMLVASLPKLWERLATLFASNMTAEEIDGARAFYVTPLGQRILLALNENFDVGPMLKDVVANPDSDISRMPSRRGRPRR